MRRGRLRRATFFGGAAVFATFFSTFRIAFFTAFLTALVMTRLMALRSDRPRRWSRRPLALALALAFAFDFALGFAFAGAGARRREGLAARLGLDFAIVVSFCAFSFRNL